jgi:hypothetical protein
LVALVAKAELGLDSSEAAAWVGRALVPAFGHAELAQVAFEAAVLDRVAGFELVLAQQAQQR